MEEFIQTVFDNRFFQLPLLEALSYIVAVLFVGAIIVGLTRRALSIASEQTGARPYTEQPPHEEDWREWRKAA